MSTRTADWGECSLTECSIEQSIFKYRPSLPANSLFIALFGVSLLLHIFQGVRSRQWVFGSLAVLGCACEMIGYGGRIIMYNNPWDFSGFIMQIVCITIAPVFMTAAIYIILHKSILRLSPSSARFRPALYYQLFIPCDILALVLQSVGGAMSSQSNGSSQAGVNIALAGLSFQVFTLLTFIVLCIDYGFRYRKDVKASPGSIRSLDGTFIFFLCLLAFATLVIFIRCAFRIYELNEGYTGAALHDQGLFIGLESIMIILATFALNVGHPSLVFSHRSKSEAENGKA